MNPENTIVSNNSGGNCDTVSHRPTSQGNNMENANTCLLKRPATRPTPTRNSAC